MDRKERIREYKQTPRPMGVFRVRNTATDASFVGTSTDLPGMLNRQRFQLELGSHPNRALQADWNASSPDAFAFEVLDTLEPSDDPAVDVAEELKTLEALWLHDLRAAGIACFNAAPRQA